MIGDREIDDVARQMTEGQPPADLVARVLGQLGDRPKRVWTLWTLAPVAAAAAIVLAAFVARPWTVRPTTSGKATAAYEAKSPATQAETVRLKADPTYRAAVTDRSGRRRYRASRAALEIDALAPPPLEMAAIEMTSIAAESIAVAPMPTIAPIPVAPLATSDERPSTRD